MLPAAKVFVENSPIDAMFTEYTVQAIMKTQNPSPWITGNSMISGIFVMALLVSFTHPIASWMRFLMKRKRRTRIPPTAYSASAGGGSK